MEDQPVKVIGQVVKHEFRFGAGQTDRANEQPEPVLLMSKDMLDVSADRRFGSVGPRDCLRHGLALGFAPVNSGCQHSIRQPPLVTL